MSIAKNLVLIVGVGNELLSDEGFGVHVVRTLMEREASFPANVRLLEAGTILLDVVLEMARYAHVILVDAVRSGGPPGTLYRWELAPGSIRRREMAQPISLHEWGVIDTIWAAEALGLLPQKITVFGAEPESIGPGTQLTPKLARASERLVATLFEEVATRRGCGNRKVGGTTARA